MINPLNKDKLLDEISRLHPEHSVSAAQLKRWVSYGLLPPPEAGKSRGRGLGVPRLWNPICIPMIQFIIASYREHKPNLDEAGRRLFAQGYTLRGNLLRTYLEEIPEQLELNLNRQRPFMKSERRPSLKASKLTDSVKRRHKKDQPSVELDSSKWIDALAEVVWGTARLSISESTYVIFGKFLNPAELRKAFNNVKDETLPILFTKSQNEFSSFGFVTRSITNLFREHGWSGAIEPALPAIHSEPEAYKLIFEFRRSALLWGVLLYVHGYAFSQVLEEVISKEFGQSIQNMITLDKLEQLHD